MTAMPIRVLLLEDNPGDARLVQAALAEYALREFAVTWVERLADALVRLGVEPFDAVLCDLSLPDSTGMATPRTITERFPALPLVVLTGSHNAGLGLGHDAIQHGAQDYLVKGKSDAEAIVRCLHYAIERKQLEMALRTANDSLEQRVAERTAELKIALTKLDESLRSARSVAETANDAIIVADHEGNIVEWNPAAERMFGYTRAEALGQPVTLIMPERYRGDHLVGLNRVQDGGARHVIGKTAELHGLTKTGVVFPIELSLSSWKDSSGLVFTGFIRDITERKQAEKALRKSEYGYRTMFDSAPEGVWMIGADRLTTEVNQRMCDLLGYAREDMLGRDPVEFADAENGKIFQKQAGLVPNRLTRTYTIALRHRDGHNIPTEFSATNLFGEDGSVLGVLAFVGDLSERIKAEKEQVVLEAQLQQAQKMDSVGRLAGGVAHDFNNMLTVILGNVALAIEQIDPAQPVHTDLVEIRKAANRSAELTRQLLAFARKQVVAPKVLDLNKTVPGIINMLQRLIGEDISLNWLPEANLWPVKVDPSQIDQVLVNLCINARDAIVGIGNIAIETGNSTLDGDYCAVHAGFSPGNYVRISVSDNGQGMDQETLAHIFEPFFTTKGVGEGTGLGLATVYGAVKQNNGFINVYSEPDAGTTFTIYLPRHQGGDEQESAAGAAGLLVRGHETILLVEDEPSILKLTERILTRQGYAVLSAKTPEEAIRVAGEHTNVLHLLITDVVMPEMNGRDLANKLQSSYPGLRVLFMSGYAANIIVHQGVLDQGVQFIQKPFAVDDLTAKVRGVLDSE